MQIKVGQNPHNLAPESSTSRPQEERSAMHCSYTMEKTKLTFVKHSLITFEPCDTDLSDQQSSENT